MTQFSLRIRLRHLLITSRWQRWLFRRMHHPILDHSCLAFDSWVDLGVSNLACTSADGSCACTIDLLAGKSRVRTQLRKR